MSREKKPTGSYPKAPDIEGLLRHADGSVDIAAYAKLAHTERAAAIAASAKGTIHIVREMLSVMRTSLAPVARSRPASGKHHAATGR